MKGGGGDRRGHFWAAGLKMSSDTEERDRSEMATAALPGTEGIGRDREALAAFRS